MKDDLEILSALLDDECTEQECNYIMHRLSESEELRETFRSYQILESRMRGEKTELFYQPNLATKILAITQRTRTVKRESVWSVIKNRIIESFNNVPVWVGSAAVTASISTVVFSGVMLTVEETSQAPQNSVAIHTLEQSQIQVAEQSNEQTELIIALARNHSSNVAFFLQ